MKLTRLTSYKGENGAATVGGTSSRTSVDGGGRSYLDLHPTLIFPSFARMERLLPTC